ncbi:MAG: UPF0182 family protein [Deltaproteobacteria bacterium]|nr:UPF0182 family protein [Deltaproteobacteria bacterium]
MSRSKRLFLYSGIAVIAFIILYIVFPLIFVNFMVDWWWFSALGYNTYFWLRLTYSYLILVGFTFLFFLVFFLNFWVASRYLGGASYDYSQSKGVRFRARKLIQQFRSGSLMVYTPFSLLLGVLLAWPFFRQWETTLLFLFAPASGLKDPVFGKDISYYLFSLPIYQSILTTLVITLILLFLGLLLLYWLESRVLSRQEQHLPRGSRIHLSTLAGLIFLVLIWNFFLQRYALLYTESHKGIFYGPGFVEMRVILPLIWLSIAFLFITAALLIIYINTGQALKFLLIFAAIFFTVLWARYTPFFANLVQKYVVVPNELSREAPYIRNNIQATLTAYDLNRVEHRDYRIEDHALDLEAPQLKISLRNIPVWDRDVLQSVYQQLQELRTYYRFPGVDVGRYTVNDVYQQVFLAPREIDLTNLPAGARNWINEHLKYTHGYGVVMTPAAQGGEEPMTWFIHGIPPKSDYGFKIEQPGIYYGVGDYKYVIAPNESREVDYPIEDGNQLSDYQGRGGVPVNSVLRKLVFAVYFGSKDIFFTTKTNKQSRLLFRRNIVERIKTLTPFFLLDGDPYVVVTNQRLYWIQDAYTYSDRFPYAALHEDRLNYIRNSVKIVVDAYHGTVDYYLADPRDPIIQAYSRMYPGLLKSMDRMPPELKAHVRYPKDLFDIQMEIYNKYHQTDPEIFYKQEDLWEFARVEHAGQEIRMTPYYLTLNLIDRNAFEFILVCPTTPRARSNLRSLCVVGCDGQNYGKILIYNFPKGYIVYGPSQVDAFIDQDTLISEQLTLWGQLGSQVERGKMILIPAGGSVLYIQPVYLQSAAGLKIPQLKRLIMNGGEITVMEPSLEENLVKLQQRMRELSGRVQRRLERVPPPGPAMESPRPREEPQKPAVPPGVSR